MMVEVGIMVLRLHQTSGSTSSNHLETASSQPARFRVVVVFVFYFVFWWVVESVSRHEIVFVQAFPLASHVRGAHLAGGGLSGGLVLSRTTVMPSCGD